MTKRKSSANTTPVQPVWPERRRGKGYKTGPHEIKPIPQDALWLTSKQVRNRYGGKSEMWLWNMVKNDPHFPKPAYQGRMQIYSVQELDEYDRLLISKRRSEVVQA